MKNKITFEELMIFIRFLERKRETIISSMKWSNYPKKIYRIIFDPELNLYRKEMYDDNENICYGENITMENLGEILYDFKKDYISFGKYHDNDPLLKSMLNKIKPIERKKQSVNNHTPTYLRDTVIYAYIDGSFNAKTNTYGYGGFIVTPLSEYIIQGSEDNPEKAKMRNVAGELDGAMCAVSKAIELGLPEITICYDYLGIEKWANGEWKTNTVFTKEYVDFMKESSLKIRIKFIHVKGHTGDVGNERADELAKDAVGIK